MAKSTDIRTRSVCLYFLPIRSRQPIKFGHQVMTHVTCARVQMTVSDRHGRYAEGWGETPISMEWAWPSPLPSQVRQWSMLRFCQRLASAWFHFDGCGHPLEIGSDFIEGVLPSLLETHNSDSEHPAEPMPRLAALVCASAFDLALHDAFGILHGRPTYTTYNREFLSRDLSCFLQSASDRTIDFRRQYPEAFLCLPGASRLPAWHLVGGLDPIHPEDAESLDADDGNPVVLTDWIRRDALTCLKIKLRGTDAAWDYSRLVQVGQVAQQFDVRALSADFNGTVTDPEYVNGVLDRLACDQPRITELLLYVEQPFPDGLESHCMDVRSVSARKPLFLDESAHDWRAVEFGRSLGWSGVALKTCKTQTGALLSLCWAKAHGMLVMVQDLANPMLAQISHVQLAAHAGTMMGVETNSSQFFPAASQAEARIHPGLYRRRNGQVDLSTIGNVGLGYRIDEIQRILPDHVVMLE